MNLHEKQNVVVLDLVDDFVVLPVLCVAQFVSAPPFFAVFVVVDDDGDSDSDSETIDASDTVTILDAAADGCDAAVPNISWE